MQPTNIISANQEISRLINLNHSGIAAWAVETDYIRRPELAKRYNPAARAHHLNDTHCHIRYFADAIALGRPSLFIDYVNWTRSVLQSRDVPSEDLAENLRLIAEAIRPLLPPGTTTVDEYIDLALRSLLVAPPALPTFLSPDQPHAKLAADYLAAVLNARRPLATRLILDAASTISIHDLYMSVLQPVQYEIGRLWQLNQITVAHEHYCTAVTQSVVAQLYPRIAGASKYPGRTILATSIGGERHELGVRMVCDLLELNGWEAWYLGADTPAPSIIRMIAERRARMIAISATLAIHVRPVADLIQALRSNPATHDVLILVGGRPFNLEPDLWKQIHADGYAPSAPQSVALANRLLPLSPTPTGN